MVAKRSDKSGSVGDLASEALASVADVAEPKAARKAVKAEKKEAKAQAKAEKKATKKAAKSAAKDTKKAVKSGSEPPKAESKRATRSADEPRVTPKKARNWIHVAQVVVPAAVPVLTPFAVRGAAALREFLDKQYARRLGTDVDTLSEFSGHGTALHVRIAGVSDSVRELSTSDNPAARQFAEHATETLNQLSSAVRAAETMPSSRRKHAYRAVSDELDEIEAKVLHHLGV